MVLPLLCRHQWADRQCRGWSLSLNLSRSRDAPSVSR